MPAGCCLQQSATAVLVVWAVIHFHSYLYGHSVPSSRITRLSRQSWRHQTPWGNMPGGRPRSMAQESKVSTSISCTTLNSSMLLLMLSPEAHNQSPRRRSGRTRGASGHCTKLMEQSTLQSRFIPLLQPTVPCPRTVERSGSAGDD